MFVAMPCTVPLTVTRIDVAVRSMTIRSLPAVPLIVTSGSGPPSALSSARGSSVS
jgi:hypothetical protein